MKNRRRSKFFITRIHRRVALLVAAATLLVAAGGPCFGSGYEFEGIGAREVSRAGAAIADSPDWTAIYWNPANIRKAVDAGGMNAGLEIFAGEADAEDSNSLSSLPVGAAFSKDELSSPFVLGAVGAVMSVGERFGIGFGFYTPLLQGVDFSDSSPVVPGMDLHYEGAAGILTWALQAAARITPRLYAGAGVNVLYGRVESRSRLTNFPIPGNEATSRLKGDGAALEGVLGLRFEPTEKLSLGAVYRTGADVPVEGEARVANSSPFLPDETTDFRYELRHPPTSGVGAAFRPVERWTLNLDFTQTYWTRFSNAFTYRQGGVFLADTSNTFHWRDAWKLRLGTGYWVSEATELLGGYSYDRYGLDPGSVDFATTVDVPMNRVYLGAAHRWSDRWESILGGVYGRGKRSEDGVNYRLSGWQIMLETQLRLGRPS